MGTSAATPSRSHTKRFSSKPKGRRIRWRRLVSCSHGKMSDHRPITSPLRFLRNLKWSFVSTRQVNPLASTRRRISRSASAPSKVSSSNRGRNAENARRDGRSEQTACRFPSRMSSSFATGNKAEHAAQSPTPPKHGRVGSASPSRDTLLASTMIRTGLIGRTTRAGGIAAKNGLPENPVPAWQTRILSPNRYRSPRFSPGSRPAS